MSFTATILSDLVQMLSEDQLDRVISCIRGKKISKDSTSADIEDILGMHGAQAREVFSLIQRWDAPLDNLCTCLSSNNLLKKSVGNAQDVVDLVWTGPVQFSVPARTTQAVAIEMTSAARSRIIVAGYRITTGAKSIFDVLSTKSSEGVDLKIILNQASDQLAVFREMWSEKTKLPDIYENESNALHAKLIVVDSNDALVTSANLTRNGLESNIEIGVRVRGQVPGQIEALLRELIRNKHFRKLDII